MEYPEAEKLILYDERDEVTAESNDTVVEELSTDASSEGVSYFSGPTWQRNKIPSEWRRGFFKIFVLSSYNIVMGIEDSLNIKYC